MRTHLDAECVVPALESAEEVVVPVTVLGELYAGFRLGTRESENVREPHPMSHRGRHLPQWALTRLSAWI